MSGGNHNQADPTLQQVAADTDALLKRLRAFIPQARSRLAEPNREGPWGGFVVSGDQLNLDMIALAIRDDLATLSEPEMFEPGREHWRAVKALQGNADALVAEVRRLRVEREQVRAIDSMDMDWAP